MATNFLLTPVQAVEWFLSGVRTLREVREYGKDNHGEMIRLFLKLCGHKEGQPWCAAFLSYVGYNVFRDPSTGKSYYPAPITAGCKVLGDWGAKSGLLFTEPQRGDFLLVHFPNYGRFAHVAVVDDVTSPTKVWTFDGNSNDDGSRNGWAVVRKHRTANIARGDRFLRWSNAFAEV